MKISPNNPIKQIIVLPKQQLKYTYGGTDWLEPPSNDFVAFKYNKTSVLQNNSACDWVEPPDNDFISGI